MWSILKKETGSFFNSLIGYLVIGLFLTGIGLICWVFPESNFIQYGFAEMDNFFFMTPFVYLFLVPAITMRSFSEEWKSGSIELLLTKPVSDWDIILGKYLASLVLIGLSLIPTLVYYFSLYQLGEPKGNIDSAAVAGSYLGLFLLGSVFCAIGLLSSSISDNQIVAFILAVFLCYLLFSGFGSVASINIWGPFSSFINNLGLSYHYSSLGKGVIDLRHVVYLISTIAFTLNLTWLVLASRKW